MAPRSSAYGADIQSNGLTAERHLQDNLFCGIMDRAAGRYRLDRTLSAPMRPRQSAGWPLRSPQKAAGAQSPGFICLMTSGAGGPSDGAPQYCFRDRLAAMGRITPSTRRSENPSEFRCTAGKSCIANSHGTPRSDRSSTHTASLQLPFLLGVWRRDPRRMAPRSSAYGAEILGVAR
jgi:hypothetical protein